MADERRSRYRWRERALLKSVTRDFFHSKKFLEVDTPIAVVCPGTEVHLQYFKTAWIDHRGTAHDQYLRSSPELHMKRALADGCEKIFQLAPCFRNGGESSPWHQPEFTMLEWYGMGQTYQGLIGETEEYLRATFAALKQHGIAVADDLLPDEFEEISVFEAFARFAGIELIDLDPDLAAKCRKQGVISVTAHDDFETAYFKTLIEKIEPEIARRKGVILKNYPPSQAALAKVENGRACRFEFYLGRVELCNGFFELTGEEENRRRVAEAFEARIAAGLPAVPTDEEFFHDMGRLSAPCAGNALGFDRWLALLCGDANLDRVIPFR